MGVKFLGFLCYLLSFLINYTKDEGRNNCLLTISIHIYCLISRSSSKLKHILLACVAELVDAADLKSVG